MEYKPKEGDFFYILDDGKPKRVLHSVWKKWMDENKSKLETTLYFVEEGIVAYFFFFGKGGSNDYDDDGKPRLWWVNEFDISYIEYQEIYDKGIRIDGFDFLEVIEQRKAMEHDEDGYEGTDNFSPFATQDEAIELLEQSYGDWKSKAIVLEPNKTPPFELNF